MTPYSVNSTSQHHHHHHHHHHHYTIKSSKHVSHGKTNASAKPNKISFFLSLGLEANKKIIQGGLISSTITCKKCKKTVCICNKRHSSTEEQRCKGTIDATKKTSYTLPQCRVVIIGSRCTVCGKSFKCQTDVMHHATRKHTRKPNEMAITLTIGNKVMARMYVKKKYLQLCSKNNDKIHSNLDTLSEQVKYYPSTLTMNQTNINNCNTPEERMKQINWPSLRIYKSEVYKEHIKTNNGDCCHKKTVISAVKHHHNNDNNDISKCCKPIQTSQLLDNFSKPIGVDNAIVDDEIEEVVRITRQQPELLDLERVSQCRSEGKLRLSDAVNELMMIENTELYGRYCKQESDNISEICIHDGDYNLDNPERNYSFDIVTHDTDDDDVYYAGEFRNETKDSIDDFQFALNDDERKEIEPYDDIDWREMLPDEELPRGDSRVWDKYSMESFRDDQSLSNIVV